MPPTTHRTISADGEIIAAAPADHRAPTARQLAYLRALAHKSGVSFTPPRTSVEASRAINELRKHRRTNQRRARFEDHLANDLPHPADATRVHDDEITGYGASATWR